MEDRGQRGNIQSDSSKIIKKSHCNNALTTVKSDNNNLFLLLIGGPSVFSNLCTNRAPCTEATWK